MKLIQTKEQSSDKKLQAAAKPARPKKPEVLKKTETPRKAVKKSGEASPAWVNTARDYLREVVVEMKKVIWPSRKETLGSTAVVLVIVGLAAVFLGLVDLVLSRLVKILVG
jgi:preprotein translocase subunit SecE